MTGSTTPPPKSPRKRAKWYAGGGLVLLLMFLLGDRTGLFRAATEGAPTGTNRSTEGAPAERPVPDGDEVDARLASQPQGEGLGPQPTGEETPANRPDPGGEKGATGSTPEPDPVDPPKKDPPPVAPVVKDPRPGRSEAARMDEVMGLIARFEQALAADDLRRVAELVDVLRQNPVVAPDSLAARWKQVQSRADEALNCGPRLRTLIRRGEILSARRMLDPLLEQQTPKWMRARIDAAAARFGWPALTPARTVKTRAIAGTTDLAKGRQVRFLRNGDLQEGELWRCGDQQATVRMRRADGYTYPVVRRQDIEPVQPEPEEALSQGRIAVRLGDPRSVMLWACHFHEKGRSTTSKTLWDLLSGPLAR